MQARQPQDPIRTFTKELTYISKMAQLGKDRIPTVRNQLISRDLDPKLNSAISELLKHFDENSDLLAQIRLNFTRIQINPTLENIKTNVDMMQKAANAALHNDFPQITSSARLMAQLSRAGSNDETLGEQPIPADIAPFIAQGVNDVHSDQKSARLAFEYSNQVSSHPIKDNPSFLALETYLAENRKHNHGNNINDLEHFLTVLRLAPTNWALKEALSTHEPLARVAINAFANNKPEKEEKKEDGWFKSAITYFKPTKTIEAKQPVNPQLLLDNLIEAIDKMTSQQRPTV